MVTDLRVSGSVTVEAPGVTLRRVVVVAPFGATALQQLAGDLTVVDSQLSGGESLTQRANGLVVRRSTLESGVTLTSGAEVYDTYIATSDLANATRRPPPWHGGGHGGHATKPGST